MADEKDLTVEDYDSLGEDELIEDPHSTTHVDLPDPDDPDSKTKQDTPAPKKRWKRPRGSSEADGE